MSFDLEGGVSKAVGLLVGILTILTIILGVAWSAATRLTTIEMQQSTIIEQVKNLTEAQKQETSKRESDEDNINRTIMLIATTVNRKGR